MMEKRMKKLETADKEIPVEEKLRVFGDKASKNMVMSWGSPKGAILEAKELLDAEGIKINFLQAHIIHPFPAADFSEMLRRAKRVIDVEMNYSGQLAGIVREKTGIKIEDLILKYNGRPMTSDEAYLAIKNALASKAPKRQVLTYGD